MAPLITTHDIKMMVIIEILEILGVCRVNKVILILLGITVIAIIEIRRTPFSIGGILLTIAPITREVHVKPQVLKAMYLIIYLHITHIVKRAGTVILLSQQCHGVFRSISIGNGGITWVIQ